MEKDKDIIEIIADEPVRKAKKNIFSGLPKGFVIMTCCISAAVIIAAPILGFSVPKSERATEKKLDALHDKDKKYITARDTKETERLEAESLRSRLSDKESELDKFRKSQDNLDKITESNISLSDEKEKLTADIEQKTKKSETLDASLGRYARREMKWNSGEYTVGKDIAYGSYLISGNGNIAIASSGKSIANKPLTEDGESFTLNDGERIHIDGNAVVTPQ